MAIIDAVIWQPQGSPVIYAHKYPENNLSTYTQLVVQESQEAVLFSTGQLMGKFGPGRHTLDSENLPILRKLYGIPFGGKNPFTAEVWFVNRIQAFNIDWRIGSLSIHDADYNTQLPLSIDGQYGLRIVEAEKFLVKVVGTRNDFTEYDMTEQFKGEFTTKVKSAVVQFMMRNHVGFKQISGYLDQISDFLQQSLAPFWDDLGLQLTKFYVSNIDIDTSTPEGRKVKEAISSQSAQSITGHTWQQEQMFNTANNALDGLGSGNGGGLLGGLMAINMMGGMGGGVGAGMMAPQYSQPAFAPGNVPGAPGAQPAGQQVRMVYCANCSKRFPSNSDYCPNCGHKYNPCPRCGSDNDESARRCVSCGTPLQAETRCPSCNAVAAPGTLFCPGCGHSLGPAQ
ncbi:MAG: SPFH domain-containing protein, partial [Muribaculaceae bacterium]|nr:SPFH domain-containing protein [Muribaculaceae bacterium]